MFKRMRYELSGDKIDKICFEETDAWLSYFVFRKDNFIFVNSRRDKISKASILFDLEVINKYVFGGDNGFKELTGVTMNFIKQVEQYGIKVEDIKEAVQRGKNYHKRECVYTKYNEGSQRVNTRYTVGS